LSKLVISNAIAKAMAERSRRTGISQDRVVNEQIPHNMGITRKTLAEWKNKYSDISDTLKRGKVQHWFKMCSR
jgi:hypothetical protein